jgi:hypothetical protein
MEVHSGDNRRASMIREADLAIEAAEATLALADSQVGKGQVVLDCAMMEYDLAVRRVEEFRAYRASLSIEEKPTQAELDQIEEDRIEIETIDNAMKQPGVWGGVSHPSAPEPWMPKSDYSRPTSAEPMGPEATEVPGPETEVRGPETEVRGPEATEVPRPETGAPGPLETGAPGAQSDEGPEKRGQMMTSERDPEIGLRNFRGRREAGRKAADHRSEGNVRATELRMRLSRVLRNTGPGRPMSLVNIALRLHREEHIVMRGVSDRDVLKAAIGSAAINLTDYARGERNPKRPLVKVGEVRFYLSEEARSEFGIGPADPADIWENGLWLKTIPGWHADNPESPNTHRYEMKPSVVEMLLGSREGMTVSQICDRLQRDYSISFTEDSIDVVEGWLLRNSNFDTFIRRGEPSDEQPEALYTAGPYARPYFRKFLQKFFSKGKRKMPVGGPVQGLYLKSGGRREVCYLPDMPEDEAAETVPPVETAGPGNKLEIVKDLLDSLQTAKSPKGKDKAPSSEQGPARVLLPLQAARGESFRCQNGLRPFTSQ